MEVAIRSTPLAFLAHAAADESSSLNRFVYEDEITDVIPRLIRMGREDAPPDEGHKASVLLSILAEGAQGVAGVVMFPFLIESIRATILERELGHPSLYSFALIAGGIARNYDRTPPFYMTLHKPLELVAPLLATIALHGTGTAEMRAIIMRELRALRPGGVLTTCTCRTAPPPPRRPPAARSASRRRDGCPSAAPRSPPSSAAG